jgi:four helix bundle protein
MAEKVRLPHHGLVAYEVATDLLATVVRAKIADARLRDQALRAAKSVCLNIAEATGRSSRADQARVFTIARGEACEAAAAVEIASIAGDCSVDASGEANRLASRLIALLTGLIRPKAAPHTSATPPHPESLSTSPERNPKPRT